MILSLSLSISQNTCHLTLKQRIAFKIKLCYMSNYCERFEMHPKTLLSHYPNMTTATESTSIFKTQKNIGDVTKYNSPLWMPMHMGNGGIHVPSFKVGPKWRYMVSYKALMLCP